MGWGCEVVGLDLLKIPITSVSLLFLLGGCSDSFPESDATHAAESTYQDMDFKARKALEQQKHLDDYGVTVVNVPPRKSLTSDVIKIGPNLCFNTALLPEGWYVVTRGSKNHPYDPKDSFKLAVKSEVLGIPYYKVSARGYDYEYVTPGQEYLTAVVQSVNKGKAEARFSRRAEGFYRGVNSGDYIPSLMVLTGQNTWGLQAYNPFIDGRGRSPVVAAPHKNAYFRANRLEKYITVELLKETRNPTSSWFGRIGRANGEFLHSSGFFTVEFETTSHATSMMPDVFTAINQTIEHMMQECTD